MMMCINNVDYRKRNVDVRVTGGSKDDYICGVDEVYLGKKRFNIPSCSIQYFDCSAYAVGITLDGRKVLMVSP